MDEKNLRKRRNPSLRKESIVDQSKRIGIGALEKIGTDALSTGHCVPGFLPMPNRVCVFLYKNGKQAREDASEENK